MRRVWRRYAFPIECGLFLVLIFAACDSDGAEGQDSVVDRNARSSYMDQDPPGLTPAQFAPDIFRAELHASLVFAPDGNTVYWSEMGGEQILFMQRVNDTWSSPQTVPFALPAGTGEPMLSPDGETLFFLSTETAEENWEENIWKVNRTAEGWSVPEPVGPGVNHHPLHWTPSVSTDGTLYFGHGGDDRDIYRSELRDGVYQDAVSTGNGVNTDGNETTPFVAPDGSYLLFSRSGPGRMADLYVSFPGPEGGWLDAIALGDGVNTSMHELCPVVTHDGEYLFFIRNVEGELKPHWVRSTVFLELRPS